MSHLNDLPLWAAVLIAIFLVIGSSLALLGSLGLVRMRHFYQRIHAPTLNTSWGTAATILASMLMFSVLNSRPIIHELVIGIFVMITTPISLLLLGLAALRRDRAKDSADLTDLARTRRIGVSDTPEDGAEPPPKG
ncbi:MAG: monovalent cation/H(+) antiporter subunit G [Paracoccus sp. (in: a-proteobacteria)]|uniref:monovalent cation/H(+) antiporter subunit G n=1 Tax=Paracoccus sp. TaxID=267 RepID=UPI0026DEC749|nr:monovalent cation/H(+) antiporter subunit G [Paracoccus sp. (in: a-proteobacteria)]MDO5613402.1 monovalent cation/H(+) antiporter subunit G [Paracoccus sp. (in: a-proteobacteria)]